MRLAHLAVVTPHRAGLYETARDLVAAERSLGVDAFIVDPTRDGTGEDRGVPIANWAQADTCNALISHSGLGERFEGTDKPIVHMLHGRPYSSFLLEQAGKIPVWSFLRQVGSEQRYRAFVTFWPEFLPYWSLLLPPAKLRAITAPVDLDLWTPNGPDGYGFHGNRGEINVVCAEVWRDDISPFHALVACAKFAETMPGVRLHVYAAPEKGTAWATLLDSLRARGLLGEVCGFVAGLDNVYRAADVAITAQHIATRSVREPMACGCPVVTAGGTASLFMAAPEDTAAYATEMWRAVESKCRGTVRECAARLFNPRRCAREFLEIVRQVTNGSW